MKWRWTREEEFLGSSTRAAWHIEIADAVTSDGWILGRRTLTLHDSGAYARFSPYGVTKHAFHHSGAYTIPNLRFDGFVCFTNRVPSTAMRGFGVTSVSFAVETHLTRVARSSASTRGSCGCGTPTGSVTRAATASRSRIRRPWRSRSQPRSESASSSRRVPADDGRPALRREHCPSISSRSSA